MSAAKKRQRIERVETAAVSVARDAIAQGRDAETVALCVDVSIERVQLALELLEAAGRLLTREGVHYTTVSSYSFERGLAVSFQTYADALPAMQEMLIKIGRLEGLAVDAYAGNLPRPKESA